MGAAYPELVKARPHVEKVLAREESRFAETLDQGMAILETAIAQLDGSEIPGEVVFKLYDTYGFPVDLTADIARERGLTIDHAEFERQMAAQRERAREASRFGSDDKGALTTDATSMFTGYEQIEEQARIVALFKNGRKVDSLAAGEHGTVVLESTPFYAESGGQVGDTGALSGEHGSFDVTDTQKSGKAILHIGQVRVGAMRPADPVTARVDAERRGRIVLNHSATHLLHAALRKLLGEHVKQKGSLVAPDRLRFDFSHYEPLQSSQLAELEKLVNDQIRGNAASETKLMTYDDAVRSGALALFGEKYEDEVRVLRLGDFSVELCGGTHVQSAGEIGVFKITSESGIAAGVRRIEAVTGKGALEWIAANQQALDSIASLLRSQRDEVPAKVEQLVKRVRDLEKELAATRQQLVSGKSAVTENVTEVDGIKVVATRMDGADAKTLRDAVDHLKDKLQNAVVVVGSVDNGKVRLAAGVTRNNLERIRAGDVLQPVAEQVGGKGGGRPDFAQAGGTRPEALDTALGSVAGWVTRHLASH
jgi:alanyl-tRNA synthetase